MPEPTDDSAFDDALAPVRKAVDVGALAGAVTLAWRGGELRHLGVTGQRDVARGLPMTTDTVFRIASMTKPVVSAAALALIEDGTIALNAPIAQWLPEFATVRVLTDPQGPLDDTVPAPRAITVEDLMTHRSGLSYSFIATGPISQAYVSLIAPGPDDPDEWLAALASLPLVHPPGQQFHYSHSTDVLGLLIGRAAGQPLNDVLRQRIFDPLGMLDTDFFVPEDKQHRLAQVYTLTEGGRIKPVRRGYLTDVPTCAPPFCRGGGALLSTAGDYLSFARMLLGGGEADGVRVLSPESVSMLRTNRLTAAQRKIPSFGLPFWTGRGFGLGVSVVLDPVEAAIFGPGGPGAFGWPGAFGTWWQADPQSDSILMLLPQWQLISATDVNAGTRTPAGMRLQLLHMQFADAAYAALQGR